MRKAARRYYKEMEREAQTETLYAWAHDWREVVTLTAFLDALETRLVGKPISPAMDEWLSWAREQVVLLDPLKPQGLDALRRHAEAVAYEPVDDEPRDPLRRGLARVRGAGPVSR